MKLTKFLRMLLRRGFSPFWYFRKIITIAFCYREYYERKKWNLAQLNNVFVINNLNREGFSLLEIDNNQVSHLIDYCHQLSNSLDPSDKVPHESEGKDFWRILASVDDVAAPHPMLLNFARTPYFKSIASRYLGQEAVLSSVKLIKSYPTGKAPTHSQKWHLDADDVKVVVFYLYINDVGLGSGPFELIAKSKMKNLFTPRYFRKHSISDDDIKKYVFNFAPLSLQGVSGTMFACDTATTYHRGSLCESSVRLALVFRYQTFSGLYPFKAL